MEETFSERIWFIGLQGSYGRNEANASSDIDMVVILDELHTEDYSLAILSGSPKSFIISLLHQNYQDSIGIG
jgi:predicted nucleotidyltransferase